MFLRIIAKLKASAVDAFSFFEFNRRHTLCLLAQKLHQQQQQLQNRYRPGRNKWHFNKMYLQSRFVNNWLILRQRPDQRPRSLLPPPLQHHRFSLPFRSWSRIESNLSLAPISAATSSSSSPEKRGFCAETSRGGNYYGGRVMPTLSYDTARCCCCCLLAYLSSNSKGGGELLAQCKTTFRGAVLTAYSADQLNWNRVFSCSVHLGVAGSFEYESHKSCAQASTLTWVHTSGDNNNWIGRVDFSPAAAAASTGFFLWALTITNRLPWSPLCKQIGGNKMRLFIISRAIGKLYRLETGWDGDACEEEQKPEWLTREPKEHQHQSQK